MSGRRWAVQDRYGNSIYLTDERWQHITASTNHPEMSAYEDHLRQTIRSGRRKQDPLNPQKYRYTKTFGELAASNTLSPLCFSGLARVLRENLYPKTISSPPTRKR